MAWEHDGSGRMTQVVNGHVLVLYQNWFGRWVALVDGKQVTPPTDYARAMLAAESSAEATEAELK